MEFGRDRRKDERHSCGGGGGEREKGSVEAMETTRERGFLLFLFVHKII